MSYLLEGDPPIQVDPSVGNLYEGSLGGVTGVGGDPPQALLQEGKIWTLSKIQKKRSWFGL